MVLSTLLRFVYPPPPSGLVTAMTVISGLSLVNAGLSEIRGAHMKYSKFFCSINDDQQLNATVSSKTGMLLLYGPAFLAGAASFWIFPNEGLSRFFFLKSALTLHFLKRLLEVLFVHKYSGSMAVDSMLPICLSYFLSTCTMIYAQHLSQGLDLAPDIDLTYPGIVLFLVGIVGNFYHHILLSKLRQIKGDKQYKIPKGGLFGLVICPHYLFEIIDIVGISFISQTLYSFSFTVGTIAYLMGRSYATRRWYLSKFDDFPKAVKAVIPFIF